ncbi:hypothetical protein CQW23_02419 [Capsicum baccatum]|uniref:Uncharacterized protein n=1 Tax=Capsicum baccatum TaxID=33114 RepID=A0A2G2XRC9_CAPBA|nr:hypothetical protein CQW23_02419 [Capsicum baccatum]
MNANDKNELNTDSTAKGCNGNQVIPAYDHALMQYADTLKKSGNSLPELLKLTHSRSYFKKNCLENESLYRKDISVVTCRKHGNCSFNADEPRACGCVQATPLIENVAPYSSIENISVQILTPESKIGMELLVKTKTPPTKASEV